MARMQIRVSKRMLFVWFTLAAFILLLSPQKTHKQIPVSHSLVSSIGLCASVEHCLCLHKHKKVWTPILNKENMTSSWTTSKGSKNYSNKNTKKSNCSGKYRDRLPLAGAGIPFAGIISLNIDHSNGKLIINRGTDDGIETGQFVIADNSIIGLISEVAPRTAKVTLSTDPRFSNPHQKFQTLKSTDSWSAKETILQKSNCLKLNIRLKSEISSRHSYPDWTARWSLEKLNIFQRDSQKPLLWGRHCRAGLQHRRFAIRKCYNPKPLIKKGVQMRWIRFATLVLLTSLLQAGMVDILSLTNLNIKPKPAHHSYGIFRRLLKH